MNIQDIISSFKEHQLQYGLNGDNNQQELYKWELITKQAKLLNTEAENFEEGIRKLNFINLCFFSQMTAFRNLAKYETENYRNAMRELLNESVDLQERISQFKSTCDSLWDNSVKNNFEGKTSAMCDERIISCFLTLKYPQKYTFYKDDVYGNLCKNLGIKKRKAGYKLFHFYELLNQTIIPEIEKEQELIDSINKEVNSKEYVHSMPLIAQTILWYNLSQEKRENTNGKFIDRLINGAKIKGFDITTQNNYKVFVQVGKSEDETDPDENIHYELCFDKRGQKTGHDSKHCFAEIHLESKDKNLKKFIGDELSKRFDSGIKAFEWEKGFPKSGFRINDEGIRIDDQDFNLILDELDELYSSTYKAVIEVKELLRNKPMKEIEILKQKKQIILQGAPGTGKTYKTAEIAVRLCDPDFASTDRGDIMKRYQELVSKKRIAFTTFHQSMDYEEFVEGIKPFTEDNEVNYEVRKGIFRQICDEAIKPENKEQNYVLIIDEINRANISKVLGELITLLEADKRIGEINEVKVKLPYSGEEFGVPNNLYIIGTMNTADRSVGYIDYAIRRRFAFITVRAEKEIIEDDTARSYFEKVEGWMRKDNIIGDIEPKDLMVGHSYFLAEDEEKLKNKMLYEVIPLLREYISDGILNADIRDDINKWEKELDLEKNN